MGYYAMIDGERRGPFELEQLAEAGVRPSTYVWCKGMADWEKAEDVADVCRMFRNRIYDLMHPSSPSEPTLSGARMKDKPDTPADSFGPGQFSRFDRQLQESDAGPLPSVEEIDGRDDKNPPSPLLLPLAIAVTILCFPPTGIAAIAYAAKAKKAWKEEPGSSTAGHYCRSAKMWTGISFFLGFILYAFLLRAL